MDLIVHLIHVSATAVLLRIHLIFYRCIDDYKVLHVLLKQRGKQRSISFLELLPLKTPNYVKHDKIIMLFGDITVR